MHNRIELIDPLVSLRISGFFMEENEMSTKAVGVMKVPVIDLKATGQNIELLRKSAGVSVKEIQDVMGFANPQAIYKWQQGKCLPSVDNLFALSRLFGVSMNEILVQSQLNLIGNGQSDDCPLHFFDCESTHRHTKSQNFQSISRLYQNTIVLKTAVCLVNLLIDPPVRNDWLVSEDQACEC